MLITTRLTPRVLLNPAGQPIQGILRVPLPGLRPAKDEKLPWEDDVAAAIEKLRAEKEATKRGG